MTCFCSKSAALLSAGLKIPPIPFSMPPGLGALSGKLSAMASGQAGAQATGGASAMAALQAGMSGAAAGKLSLLASLMPMLKAAGAFPPVPGVPSTLPGLMQSLNANIPQLAASANVPGLQDLGQLAGLLNQLKAMGINPASANAAGQLQAKMDAMAMASASGGASGGAKAMATAQGNASAMAGMALGLPMTPDPMSQLKALVDALKNMPLPPLTIPPAAGAQLMGSLNAMAQVQMAFGTNLGSAGAVQGMLQGIASMNLQALASVKMAAAPAAQASAFASASAMATGALSAQMSAALAPLPMSTLGSLFMANALLGLLKALGALIPTKPCDVCRFLT